MSIFSQLGKAAADSLIGSMANAGGIGALLGGGLGGVKGLILPDAEVDEEGNPTGKRKGRLSSALRSGGMGALFGGALGAGVGAKLYNHGLREEMNRKHKDFVAKLNSNDDNKPLVAPYIDEAQKVKAKALFNFPRSTIGGPNDAAAKVRSKYMIDPNMLEYVFKQKKLSEEAESDQIRLITEGLYDKADAKGKLRAISENSITSPTALDMAQRALLKQKGFIGDYALPMPENIEEHLYGKR
jgi:hypothetical protein